MLKFGIDASNIISGGGLTHLVEILKKLNPRKFDLATVDVWASDNTLDHIGNMRGINLKRHSWLNAGLIKRNLWQKYILTGYAKEEYDLLYVPGGSYLGDFHPFVTMNRNLQPFHRDTIDRYNFSPQKLRIRMLSKIQSYTYRKAEGIIFLSEEAKKVTLDNLKLELKNSRIIPHGVASKFFREPQTQYPIEAYNQEQPYRFLYVSTINLYKHQWNVIEAVHSLRMNGYPVVLDLVGSIKNKQSERLFREAVNRFDPDGNFVFYHGALSQDELLKFYHTSDAFVFASSCETFGQILLEAMASGLPIACSNRSAMPEILEDAGYYFNPENGESIKEAIQSMLLSADDRYKYAEKAHKIAGTYSWKRCSGDTFEFLKKMYKQYKATNN